MSTQIAPPDSAPAPVEHDDYSIDGTEPDTVPAKPEAAGATTEDETAPDLSKAAAALGKAGGAAAAAKRKEAREAAEPVAEPEEDPEPVAAKAEEAGNPRHDPKARMLEATRQSAEAKRELHAERQRRQELENRLSALERAKPEPEKAEDPDPEPKEEDFESYAEFVKNTGRWAARQEHAQLRQADAQRSQVEAFMKDRNDRISKFASQLGKRDESEPGWRDSIAPEIVELQPTFTLAEGQRPTAMNVLADEIISSEQAPALMLHLTEHPEDLQRIAALQTPRDISREMARLEARLGAATAGASPKPAVKPNPPLRPVSGSAHTADVEPDDDASYDEHVRYHNAKEKRGRR